MTDTLTEASDHGPSDAALIEAVRRGDTGAYGLLYERHLGAARRAASAFAATHTEREDLVAEAFTRVLRVLRSGNGPTGEFRAYLLVTMRNTAINAHRHNGVVSPYADVPENPQTIGMDPVGNRLHAEVAADAFASLPERWRTVLWLTEVEGKTPVDVARVLGMTANGVAALAYRAREGLRRAYLQQHLSTSSRGECRAVGGMLAGWVRHSISVTKMRRVTAHLNRCPECRRVASGLVELNHELPGVMPLTLLVMPLAGILSSGTVAAAALSVVKVGVTAAACSLGAAAAIATTAVTVAPPDPLGPPTTGGVTVSTPILPPPATRLDGTLPGPGGGRGSGVTGHTPGAPPPPRDDAAGVTEPAEAPAGTAETQPDSRQEKQATKAAKQARKEATKEVKEARTPEKAEKQAAKRARKAGR